jgi:hypothetical protein
MRGSEQFGSFGSRCNFVFSIQPSLVKKAGKEASPPEGGRGWFCEVPKRVNVIAYFVIVIII